MDSPALIDTLSCTHDCCRLKFIEHLTTSNQYVITFYRVKKKKKIGSREIENV